jgi:hypothetical protein
LLWHAHQDTLPCGGEHAADGWRHHAAAQHLPQPTAGTREPRVLATHGVPAPKHVRRPGTTLRSQAPQCTAQQGNARTRPASPGWSGSQLATGEGGPPGGGGGAKASGTSTPPLAAPRSINSTLGAAGDLGAAHLQAQSPQGEPRQPAYNTAPTSHTPYGSPTHALKKVHATHPRKHHPGSHIGDTRDRVVFTRAGCDHCAHFVDHQPNGMAYTHYSMGLG